MASLLDIAPSTSVAEAVRVNGDKRIVVHKLSADAIAAIAARFPETISLILSGKFTFGPHLIQQIGKAIGPIIAAATGNLGNEEEERAADRFLFEDQLKLITAIWQLTFPNGTSFLAETLTKFASGTGEGAKVYKIRSKKSPSPSQPSSETVSRQIMR